MFNIGTQEFLVILLVALLLFGAEKIPEISRALGKGLADFRDALSGFERELKGEGTLLRPPPAVPPTASQAQTALPRPGEAVGGPELNSTRPVFPPAGSPVGVVMTPPGAVAAAVPGAIASEDHGGAGGPSAAVTGPDDAAGGTKDPTPNPPTPNPPTPNPPAPSPPARSDLAG